MLDDHRRAQKLREEPRTDLAMAHRMQRFVEALQTRIVKELERIEREAGGDATFGADRWERANPDDSDGGGGLSRVIEGGAVWEKGGVNVSAVYGPLPERMALAFEVPPTRFFATGLSLVVHPRNPYVPTVHANFRYFALGEDLGRPQDQWFGGGADLTPYYPERADAAHFHGVWKRVCDAHPGVADYAAFKRACDAYFFLPHRQEARGVGGVFFDYLRDDPEGTFLFVRQAGRAFLSSYVPVAERHAGRDYGERERRYQAHRRGRYAEFNLVYDRGTRFGLETGGRTESILMSLPPVVNWSYDWHPEPGTPEAAAQDYFRPHDWLGSGVPGSADQV
ncbi:MAG: oxygen-dependent coproporphyrinogen oxidase [Rhodothermales bacterium]|nr:oxygen-dependent coproporphyrinogen oxidase [Rhodothermales bacterium]